MIHSPAHRPRASGVNVLELLSILQSIPALRPVAVQSTCVDSHRQQATAAYLNRQGGVRSAQLLNAARRLLFWARTHVALHQSVRN